MLLQLTFSSFEVSPPTAGQSVWFLVTSLCLSVVITVTSMEAKSRDPTWPTSVKMNCAVNLYHRGGNNAGRLLKKFIKTWKFLKPLSWCFIHQTAAVYLCFKRPSRSKKFIPFSVDAGHADWVRGSTDIGLVAKSRQISPILAVTCGMLRRPT